MEGKKRFIFFDIVSIIQYNTGMKLKNASHSVNDLYWFILPVILPGLLAKFDLSYGKAGGVLTLFLFIGGIGSFFSGKISDTLGRKEILGYGFLLSAAGFTAAGFAPSLKIFLIIIAVTAVGVSTFHPVMYAVIDETVKIKKGKTLGIYEAFGTGAILLMYLVNGFLISRIGIRGVLVVTAFPAAVMGIIFLLTKSIPPPAPVSTVEIREKRGKKNAGSLLVFLLFIAAIITRIFTVTAVLNFLPILFVNYLGFPESSALYISSLFFAGGIIGSLYIGRISDSGDIISILLYCSMIIVVSIFLLSFHVPRFIYPLSIFILGITGSGAFVNQNLLMTRLGSQLGKGEIFGILMGAVNITAAVSPLVFGIAIDHLGFSKALLVILVPGAAGILLLIMVRKKMRALNLS